MKPILFRGSGVALATPFTEDGLDEARLRQRIEWQIQQRTDALVICGTTGEPSTMPQDERDRAVEIALEVSAGRVPVIVGTGSNSTKTCVKLSKRAEALGADGLLIVTPYYNRPSQKGLLDHYLAVSDEVNLPIVLYNVPSRTGANLLPETNARLAERENIVALKEANGDLVQLMQTIALVGDKLAIYSGEDTQVLPIMALGGCGVISVAANVIPHQVHDMACSFLMGDVRRCRTLQLLWLPLIKLLFVEPNPQPLKAALKLMGMDSGIVRPPLAQVSDQVEARIRAELDRMGLLEGM